MRTIALAGFLLAALPAAAADKQWTPAPVPSVGSGTTESPSARAGRSDGPSNDAPLSGIPTRSVTAGGATSSNQTNSVGTPSLSR